MSIKIENKDIIRVFIDTVMDTINYDYKNDFVGVVVTKENEHEVAEAMHEAGFHDFQEKPWPSLFLEVDPFLERPYHKNISYKDIVNEGSVAFETRYIPGNQLFNVEALISDPNRALNDSMTLRALDKGYDAQVLTIDGDTWMLDVYSEAFTIDPLAEKSKGKVLTFGLGMGYFVYMAMLNKEVDSITVIEKDPQIIELFKKYIEPQFPNTVALTIIEGDAFDYFTKDFVESFDYVFVDTYQSADDGYLMMEKMLEQYIPHSTHTDFWIEDSCIEFIRSIIVIYFDQVLEGVEPFHNDPFYNGILKKVTSYMERIETISSFEEIKTLLYDRDIIRSIIGEKS